MIDESNFSDEDKVEIFPTLLSLALDNNAMLSMLMRVVGELQAAHRGKDPDEQIKKLFDEMEQEKARHMLSLVKRK